MNTPSTRLESLKKKHSQLTAQIQLLEAAKKNRERKKGTRRKILIGAYILDKATTNRTFNQIVTELDTYLTRSADRALFDLPETG